MCVMLKHKRIFRNTIVGVAMFYLNTKVNLLNFNDSLVTTMKPKAKYRYCTVKMLFYIIQQKYQQKLRIFEELLTHSISGLYTNWCYCRFHLRSSHDYHVGITDGIILKIIAFELFHEPLEYISCHKPYFFKFRSDIILSYVSLRSSDQNVTYISHSLNECYIYRPHNSPSFNHPHNIS
jgi:hypothetical protein